MKVVETTIGTERSHEPNSPLFKVVERVLRKVIPAANPDFDSSYANVRKWWIEVDDTGTPQRELGFDAQGEVIVGGPIGENFGFWTDSTMIFNPDEYNAVSDEAFGSAWSSFEDRWEANIAGGSPTTGARASRRQRMKASTR